MPEPTTEFNYNSIEELNKAANKIWATCKIKADDWVSKCQKLLNEAENEKERDMETAYIYYYRGIQLFTAFSKTGKTDEKYIKSMLGQDLYNAMRQLETLKEDLNKIYDEKKLKRENESNNFNKPKDTKRSKIVSATSQHDADDVPIIKNIKHEEFSLNENKTSLTCQELYETVKKSSKNSVLVIDVRLKNDFTDSSINVPSLNVINIPENLLSKQIPSTLEKQIDPYLQQFFKKRGEYDLVVVVDWFSTEKNMSSGSAVKLINMIKKFDTKIKYKREPVILEGGYDEWRLRYPNFSTNPDVSPPKRQPTNDRKITLENIDYPSTALLEPTKIENKPIPPPEITKPTFDRSTKPILQERKTEIVKENGNFVENVEQVDIPVSKKPVENSEERDSENRSSFDEQEEKLKYNCIQPGRRVALTSLSNQPPITNNDVRPDENDDIDEAYRNEEKENRMNKMKTVNSNMHNDIGSGIKRYSSTPNISKIENEYSRPPIDRTTKPSNDDQFNIFTQNSVYGIEEGRGLTGLLNVGNTCYMNSIIQCLSNTKPLREAMCKLQSYYCNGESKTRGSVALEVSNIIKQLWAKHTGSISCRTLKQIVGQYRDTFKGSEQQDSHEFLTILIDWLHEDLNKPETGRNLKGADEKSGEKAWGEYISKNNSIIRVLFYGQQKSTVSCNTCSKQSVTFEPFSNLSLPLPSSEKCTLAECLRLYTSNESIFGWQCPDCKCPRAATKKLDITKLPPLLVIHFKRFTSDGWCRKRMTNVDFPDLLDMTPYLIGQEHRNRRYELYAVSNHMGTMETGHYTAFCRNSVNHRWYKFDDDNVVSINAVPKSSSAYIVFYQCLLD